MNKLMEATTVSVQVYPTATTAKSGSAGVDMSQYKRAVAKLYAHRLPDAKGEGVITLSLYENTATTPTGTLVTGAVVTGSITSASDVYLEVEVDGSDLEKQYVYGYVASSTATQVAVTIDRGSARYEDV
jgi:hypothetical protein